MSGINVMLLKRDYTIARKKINSKENHVHFGSGSYLNLEAGILATQKHDEPPVLIYQEGIATPKTATKPLVEDEAVEKKAAGPLEAVKWQSWYLPMLRGLNRRHHGRGNLMATFGKLFNLKTFPFWVIGLAVLAQLLAGG